MSKSEPTHAHGFHVGQRVEITRGDAHGEIGTIEWFYVDTAAGWAIARVYFAAGRLQGSTVVVRVPGELRAVEEP
jgi:hypothetical protein